MSNVIIPTKRKSGGRVQLKHSNTKCSWIIMNHRVCGQVENNTAKGLWKFMMKKVIGVRDV